MKTIKIKLLFFLAFISFLVNAQDVGTNRSINSKSSSRLRFATLTSFENETTNNCSGRLGASFNLTFANSLLLNGLNPNEYQFFNYRLNDRDGFSPMPPLNNYPACNGDVMYVTIQNINNPQVYFLGRISLLVTRAPRPIYSYQQDNNLGDLFLSRTFYPSLPGLSYTGVAFKAFYSSFEDAIPVYRYFNPQYADHFYTVLNLPQGTYGYDAEGIEFYAYQTQRPGTVPVYRYFNQALINHFYTTDFSLYGSGSQGYVLERIEFYAYPSNYLAFKNSMENQVSESPKDTTDNFSAYPNPTQGFLTFKNEIDKITSIEINNLYGKIVKSFKVDNIIAEIDISDLPKGIYIAKVKSEGEEKSIRIIKE